MSDPAGSDTTAHAAETPSAAEPFAAIPDIDDEGPPRWAPVPGVTDAKPAIFAPIPGLDEPTRYAAQPPAAPANAPPSRAVVIQRLRAYLAKLPRGECPFCGGTHYNPRAWVQILAFNGPANDAPLVKSTPAISLECSGCGFVATINAIAAGILPAEQSAAAPAAE